MTKDLSHSLVKMTNLETKQENKNMFYQKSVMSYITRVSDFQFSRVEGMLKWISVEVCVNWLVTVNEKVK